MRWLSKRVVCLGLVFFFISLHKDYLWFLVSVVLLYIPNALHALVLGGERSPLFEFGMVVKSAPFLLMLLLS